MKTILDTRERHTSCFVENYLKRNVTFSYIFKVLIFSKWKGYTHWFDAISRRKKKSRRKVFYCMMKNHISSSESISIILSICGSHCSIARRIDIEVCTRDLYLKKSSEKKKKKDLIHLLSDIEIHSVLAILFYLIDEENSIEFERYEHDRNNTWNRIYKIDTIRHVKLITFVRHWINIWIDEQ